MKILRIALENFRGVERREVRFDEVGVTVLVGRNEAGKTSLVDALQRIIEYRDDSKHRDVLEFRPVGRDVGTAVEVELTTGPYRLVYRKRWFREKGTELEVLEPRLERLAGREAHERVLAILEETLDVALWKALSIQQGFSQLAPSLKDQRWLSRALDASAADARAGELEDTLLERAAAEFARYYTDTGREKKELTDPAARLVELAAERERAAGELAKLVAHVDKSERLERDLAAAVLALDGDERSLAQLDEQVTALQGVREDARIAASELETARVVLEHAERDARARRDLAAELEAEERARRELEQTLAAEAPELEAARAEADAKSTARRAAEATAEACGARKDAASADLEYLRDRFDLAQLEQRRARVTSADDAIAHARSTLDSIAVDERSLAKLRDAARALDLARARASEAGARVRLHALGDVAALIQGSPLELAAGDERELTLDKPLSIELPGQLRLELRPGADAHELAGGVERAAAALRALLEGVRASDPAHAEQLAAARSEAARTLEEKERARGEALDDLTREQMDEKIQRLHARSDDYLGRRTLDAPLPEDASQARRIAEEQRRAAEVANEAAKEAKLAEDATRERTAKRSDAQRTRLADLESVKRSLESLRRRLEDARAAEADTALDERVQRARETSAAALERVRAAERELERQDAAGLEMRLANQRRAVDLQRKQVTATRTERAATNAVLEAQGESGLRERVDDLERKLAIESDALERLRARAAAARLLYETLREERDRERQSYVAPLKEQIDRLGRVVYGPSFGVELSDDLSIVGCTRDELALAFDSLSTGTKEQLGILARLACALLVAPDGGVPLVLDDVLGHTDPERLAAMGAVLDLAGEQCQVLLLTSSPERYRHIGRARRVEIDAAR